MYNKKEIKLIVNYVDRIESWGFLFHIAMISQLNIRQSKTIKKRFSIEIKNDFLV